MNNVCEKESFVQDSGSNKKKAGKSTSPFKLFPLHVSKCPKLESLASGDTAKTMAAMTGGKIDEITNETLDENGTKAAAGEKSADPPEREMWARKTEFLLAIIGFSVDLGNIWRCKT